MVMRNFSLQILLQRTLGLVLFDHLIPISGLSHEKDTYFIIYDAITPIDIESNYSSSRAMTNVPSWLKKQFYHKAISYVINNMSY